MSDKFRKYYHKHLVPLVRMLGIQLGGVDSFAWTWHPRLRPYAERVYTMQFRNLTEDGQVSASAALIELFPDLLLRAESRVRSHKHCLMLM